MPLDPTDEPQIAHYRAERDRLLGRLAHVDRILAVLTDAGKSTGAVAHHQAPPRERQERTWTPPLPANTLVGAEGEFMGLTLRDAIRRYLKDTGGPAEAPAIAQALFRGGFQADYGKLKSNVDTTLKRMRANGQVEKTEHGWQVPTHGLVTA